ncbi:acyltransferase [Parashewanella curva]|uniref:Acyltransferase n=1 Tax=Parashewanella curva TaxID=2338552 RepID=A0A3L8PS13_9GAMM|nr:acyltransferase [Parashewanella curva]RLV58024.1 acyltransferase [Parashewanella curva]
MPIIRGSIAFSCYVINTLFWMCPIIIFGLFKLIPLKASQTLGNYILDHCASGWISVNGFIERLFHPVQVKISGTQNFQKNEWYMITANHQSWVDILILQRVFNRKIPFIKFFLKKELIYVPVLGLAWWALDFPFMRRYTSAQIRKNPKLKGKDIEVTRKACEKFKHKPVSIMNFVEGTRFTTEKHQQQKSPYQHLLRPKAGGLAFALSSMKDCMNKMIDVTIHYPEGIPSFWQFISGQMQQVKVHIEVSDIEPEMIGDYANDRQFKQAFQQQLSQRWEHKDSTLHNLKAHS